MDGDNKWKNVAGEELFGRAEVKLAAGGKVAIGGKSIDVFSQVSADKAITIRNRISRKI